MAVACSINVSCMQEEEEMKLLQSIKQVIFEEMSGRYTALVPGRDYYYLVAKKHKERAPRSRPTFTKPTRERERERDRVFPN